MSSLAEVPRFGILLRRLRTAAALSQEELAERAGLSVRAISDLERGVHRAPRLETIRLLADALRLGEPERSDLLAAARPEATAATSAERDRAAGRPSLPIPPTRLIGREAEVAEVRALLVRSEVRLVTLTGSGGTGKTHLALAVAARVRDRYPDGVWFVDLSPLTDPDLVLPVIATALGVRETASTRSPETLGFYLRDRRLLLVLDNCEQVLEAAPAVAALLAECPNLAILATSRAPLHIRAEQEVAVGPLSLPGPGRLLSLAELEEVAAVALFVERARAATVEFSLTASNAAAVVGICRRLDGLPLAIELAAARIKALPPAALLARLEQRLPLLTGGGRDLPARQRTMRDAIAWSYDLLASAEQGLFRRLAVFAGGFTLAAAEAVVDAESGLPVLDSVIALVEQSLLRQIPGAGDEPRYQMFETVREFGLEQLAAAGEADETRQRHADHYLSISETFKYGLVMESVTASLAAERDNVLLALKWFDDHGDADALLQLSFLPYWPWLASGAYREGLQWIERALELAGNVPSTPRVNALVAASAMAIFQGDYARAAAYVAQNLTLTRTLGDPFLVGRALHLSGLLAYRQGDYAQAEVQLDEAFRLRSEPGGRVPDAVRDSSLTLLVLGDTALAQKQYGRAVRRYQASIQRMQGSRYIWEPIDARAGLAGVSYCMGDLARAAALYVECLDEARDRGAVVLVVSALNGLAGVAAESGKPEEGARLLGAAEGIMATLGLPIFPRDRPVRERALAALAAGLGQERLALTLEEGRALTADRAIAEAKMVAAAVRSAP
jgi:predicted ATPase/DNA-binding XRE family transcriptional regulator